MKILSCLLLGFKWQQRLELTLKMASQADKVVGRNNQILQVLETAGKVGQVGSLASEEDQQLLEEVAKNAGKNLS